MISKTQEKELAIQLRKQGKSYSEIRRSIPVAKSTLSIWFREVHLSKRQEQKITTKRIEAQKRGAEARRTQRIRHSLEIKKSATQDIKNISERELFLIGVTLYWAEGAKEKEYRPSAITAFSNSDPNMIALFRKWLIKSLKIDEKNLIYELYIHKTADRKTIAEFWKNALDIEIKEIRVYFKKAINNSTNRHNKGEKYFGTLRIKVKRSIDLTRKIDGWIEAIVLKENCQIV